MKYEIVDGHCVALKDFGFVKKGHVGGCVDPGCLSQEGNCWVFAEAEARDNSRVSDNCRVSGFAQINDNAQVSGNSRIYGDAQVSGNVRVSGNSVVHGYGHLRGNVRVSGFADVTGSATLGHITRKLSGNAIVISGLRWPVTIMDDFIQIGCVCWKKEWWANADDEDIQDLASGALKFWKANKTRILG